MLNIAKRRFICRTISKGSKFKLFHNYLFNQSSIPYLLDHCHLKSEKELINKRWKFGGVVNFWKREAKYVVHGTYVIALGDSEIEKKKKRDIKNT